ncbi:MAG: hypothetical protein HGA25_07535 [Clostridiales bacterium]|nr:hypothetical protein [Clostridiales bacterium]
MESSFYSFEEREGFLRINLKSQTLKELSNPAYLAVRQKYADFSAKTMFEFQPKSTNEVAGMAIVQSNQFNLRVEITISDSAESMNASVIFARSNLEEGANGGDKVVVPVEDEIIVRKQIGSYEESKRFFINLICFRQEISVYVGTNEENYTLLAEHISIRELCSEKASGFVGNTIGMYASSNGVDSENYADFGWLSVYEL